MMKRCSFQAIKIIRNKKQIKQYLKLTLFIPGIVVVIIQPYQRLQVTELNLAEDGDLSPKYVAGHKIMHDFNSVMCVCW